MASLFDLFVSISGDNSKYKTVMRDSRAEAEKFGAASEAVANRVGAAFSKLAGAAGISIIGVGALAAAHKFEEAGVQIQRSTGATGERLKALEDSFASVYKRTAASSDQVVTVLTLLSTRTQATGKDLENLTLKTIALAKTQKEDVAAVVPLVTRAFGDWSIAAGGQGKAMDYLRVVSQQTGTAVSRLAEQVVYAGAPLRQLGYSFEQSTALIGKFEKEGVNTELVLGGMKAALQKFAKEGVTDTAGAWHKFVEGVKSGAVTFKQVAEEVGAKRAVDLYKAIQEGRFEIDKMVDSSKRLATDGGQNIETFKSKFTKLQHEIEAFAAKYRDIIITVGLAWPAVASIGGAIANLLKGAFAAAGATFSGGALVIPVTLTIAGIAGWFAGDAMQKKFAPGGNTTPFDPNERWRVSGHEVVPNTPGAGIGDSLLNFINGLAGGKAAPPPPVPGLSDEDARKYFSALGLKDLRKELAEAVTAFQALAAAGKLTHDQMLQAALGIQKVRNQIKGPEPLTPERMAEFMVAASATVKWSSGSTRLPTLDDLRNLPSGIHGGVTQDDLARLPQISHAYNTLFDAMVAVVNEQQLLARNQGYVTDAFHAFNLQTPEETEATAREMEGQFNELKDSGKATAQQIQVAWEKMFRAQIAAQLATNKITQEQYDDLLAKLDANHQASTQRHAKYERTIAEQLGQQWKGAAESLERNLGRAVATWKGGFDAIKGFGQDLAADLFSSFFKGLLKPLEGALENLGTKVGKVFDGIWGGASGASGAAGKAAGGVGSAGGAAGAASGVMGTIGAVSAAVGAISSIVGNFQMAGMNKSLDVLVNHTLRIFNELASFRTDAWTREAHWYVRTSDMWQTMLDIKDALGRGISTSGGSGGRTFNNCTFNGYSATQIMQAAFDYQAVAG